MRQIRYSDIIKRKTVVSSTMDTVLEANCKLYNSRAKKSFNPDDVIKFIEECSKSSATSTMYLSDITFMVENVSDQRILPLFESEILPKVKDYKLPKQITNIDEATMSRIDEQLLVNKVCDRILENHETLNKKGISKYTNENTDLIINKCCDFVAENSLPLHGKVCVALEEAKYILESNNREYDSSRLTSIVLDYFSIKEQFLGEEDKIAKSIRNNSYISEAVDDVSGSPMAAIEIFKLSPEKNADLLQTTMEDILKVDNYNLKGNISSFFDLLKEILIASNDEELCSAIYQDIIPSMYECIFKDRIDDPELKMIATNIKSLIGVEIEIANMYSAKYNNVTVSNHMLHYMKAMEELFGKFTDIEDMAYTEYNIECMNTSIEESDVLISLDEFKIFKFQNLLTMSRNIDNYFKEKLSGVRHKASTTMKKLKSKIFGESTVYDTLLEDGSVDFIVCTVESEVNAESQNEISAYCKAVNESMLYDTEYNCYYTSNEGSFDIHIKENCMVSLTESELKELNEYVTLEDKYNMEKILELSNCDSYFDEEAIIDFFTENQKPVLFRSFIEVCSLANIDKDIVKNIHESVFNRKTDEDDHITFYHGTASVVRLYEIAHSPLEIQMEAIGLISSIVEAKDEDEDDEEKKPSLKERLQVKKDIKENEKAEKKEKDKETIKKASGNEDALKDPDKATSKEKKDAKKDIKVNDKLEKKESKEEASKKEVESFSVKLNNIQLYIQGLKKKMKDMSAKEQEISKRADSTFNNFAKACKNALISDRREAIIKGSVIPSFSKCVKIGISMAGLYFVNPLAAVITALGGLAMSKRLTKKERALLLDELEVELEMIDKEIQNADNKNQLKKERALMMQKKNLQRQYQRIKYNIRIGKDLVPSSSMGIKDSN